MRPSSEQSLAKPKKHLPLIPMWWTSTTAPALREESGLVLPTRVELTVTSEAIRIKPGEINADDKTAAVEFPKSEIISVEIALAEDGTGFGDMRWVPNGYSSGEGASTVTIRHADPYAVRPHLESVFTSHKRYWIEALAKELKDKLGVPAKMTQKSK